MRHATKADLIHAYMSRKVSHHTAFVVLQNEFAHTRAAAFRALKWADKQAATRLFF